MANPELNINFLQFIRRLAIHCLKVEKTSRQMPANNIYPRKNSWKRGCTVTENERTKVQTLH